MDRQGKGEVFSLLSIQPQITTILLSLGALMPPSNLPDRPLRVTTAKPFPAADGSLEICSPPSPCLDSSTSPLPRSAALPSPGMPGNGTSEDGPTKHLQTDGFLPKLPREEGATLLFHLPPSEVTFPGSLPAVRIQPSPAAGCVRPAVLY